MTIMAFAAAMCLSGASNENEGTMKPESDGNGKVLVAFFSHTGENYGVGDITKGNTCIIAEMIAEETGGDLFEIVPEKDYPTDYVTCTEVAKREASNAERPAIKSDKDIDGYDTIYIGYPIWWGEAPMPIYTWVEKHDWSGKTVIPFCTHEGSGLGDSGFRIGKACKGAKLSDGFELRGTTAQKRQDDARKAVRKWLGE